MAHPNYDEFWQKRSISKHEKNIEPAVLAVGGWFDAEDPYGVLRLNQSLDSMSKGTTHTIVMGPGRTAPGTAPATTRSAR